MTERRLISSGSAFEEQIGYSRAVVDGDWVHVSGTTGFDYATMTISDDVVEQAEQCLANVGAALGEAGCAFADVVRVRYMLPDADDFAPCWPVLRRRFGDVRPAATMLSCGLSDPRMKIEVEVTARRSAVETVTHSPTEGVYSAGGDYAHAIDVRGAKRLVFVAGTMGLDPAGRPGASLEEQLELVWSNIRAILASAGMTVANVVRVTSYLRDRAYMDGNARARVDALGGRVVPTTAIVAETLESDWMVEIEVIAAG